MQEKSSTSEKGELGQKKSATNTWLANITAPHHCVPVPSPALVLPLPSPTATHSWLDTILNSPRPQPGPVIRPPISKFATFHLFQKLPQEIRTTIWTLVAAFQPPRTVSTANIRWINGEPHDANQPVVLHQICRETSALKTSGSSLHGHHAFELTVLTCTPSSQEGEVRFIINPGKDMLYITDNHSSDHGTLMAGLGSSLLHSLHGNGVMEKLRQLTLCCHDLSFPLIISQLAHFTSLKLLMIVTGTFYVRPTQHPTSLSAEDGEVVKVDESKEKAEPGKEKRTDRFDAQPPHKTIWWVPDQHSYSLAEFLSLKIYESYQFRTKKPLLLPGGKETILIPCIPLLPQVKLVARTEWIASKFGLNRIRRRMGQKGMEGRGHRVLSEARYERVWLGREEVDFWRRQMRGKDVGDEQRVGKRAMGVISSCNRKDGTAGREV